MKKWIAVMLCLCLAAGMIPAMAEETPVIKYMTVPFVFFDPENAANGNIYFIGDSDVPYVSLEDWGQILSELMTEVVFSNKDISYKLKYSSEGETGTLKKENGCTMTVDCEKDTITFMDFDDFIRPGESWGLIDMLSVADSTEEKPTLFRRFKDFCYDRYGKEFVLEAGKYGIDLVKKEDTCFVPLLTLRDFTLSTHGVLVRFTGETVVFAGPAQLEDAEEELTPFGELFASGEKGEVSEAMAAFNYAELCMAFDNLYGLKETHAFSSFDEMADEVGLRDELKSTDPEESDRALIKMIAQHLDDLHSAVNMPSPRIDKDTADEMKVGRTNGFSFREFSARREDYKKARAQYYSGKVPVYEEIGNTAYITFDEFVNDKDDAYYYSNEPDENEKSTIGIMLYAYSRIMREGSPIENVVLDLSNNTGGEAESAALVIAAFLGDGYISIKNTMSGALSTTVYNVDMNLDRQFDEEDFGLRGKKLFCLISPVSFSCGNLVPSVFRNSHRVTLIGDTTGGGSCMVLQMVNALGTVFQISSPNRMSFTKNGSFYDTDRGVEPDFNITDPAFLYDRAALTEYINGLK